MTHTPHLTASPKLERGKSTYLRCCASRTTFRSTALSRRTWDKVNTARGPIVDETALYRALVEGRIAGAGLDVFEDEPLKAANPLVAMSNVVATPHALARSWESAARTANMVQDAVLAILDGRLPEMILNPDVKSKGAG